MPAIVDHDPDGGGEPIALFESGAILLYLAEKTGRLQGKGDRGRYEAMQWVVWQMANQGPKFGECGHFRRLGDRQGDQSYALRRFGDETNRILGVMNCLLYERSYLAGDEYSMADIASYPWATGWERMGENIEEFTHLKRWLEELGERPGVQRGMDAGKDLGEDYEKLPKEELERRMAMLYNQRARPAPDGR